MPVFSKPKVYYKGFSTANYEMHGKTLAIADVELVKTDLLNHIFTSKGERVMMPKFGTRIPDLAFEPLDQLTIAVVEEDIRAVVAYDPRVELKSLNVYALPDNNALIATVDLYYIEFDVTDALNIEVKLGS